MTTFVSRRTLPGMRVDLFAAFLDGMRHGFQVRRINRTYEAHKLAARRSGGHREAARVIQDLPLLRRGQAVNLLDNLVFDRLRHNKTNLGKGFRNVKGPRVQLTSSRNVRRVWQAFELGGAPPASCTVTGADLQVPGRREGRCGGIS